MGFAGRMGVAVVGALALAALGFLLLRSASQSPVPRVVRTFQLTRDPGLEADPAISPDGRFVAYAKGPIAETRIYVQQVSGGRAVPLTAGLPGTHTRPRWSPDGAQIAFSTDFGGQDDGIAVVPALGGAPRRIAAQVWEPAWSPDGEEIAYLGGPTGEGLFVVPVRGGEPRRLIERIVEVSGLAWARGNRLAYSAGNATYLLNHMFPNLAPSSLWTVSARGGEPVRLTEDGHLDHSPVFTSDGAHLFFVSNRGGSRDVYRIGVGSVRASRAARPNG